MRGPVGAGMLKVCKQYDRTERRSWFTELGAKGFGCSWCNVGFFRRWFAVELGVCRVRLVGSVSRSCVVD